MYIQLCQPVTYSPGLLIEVVGVFGGVPPVVRVPSGQEPLIPVFNCHFFSVGETKKTASYVIEKVDAHYDLFVFSADAVVGKERKSNAKVARFR